MSSNALAPIVFDDDAPLIWRYALHAAMLGFTHPITNERLTFQARVHEDMKLLIQLLRQNRLVARPRVAGSVIDLDAMIGP